jgi:hypothetical protein
MWCSRCGTPRVTGTTSDVATLEVPVPPRRQPGANGELDLGFSYPVKVWSGVERDYLDAYQSCEQSYARAWGERETLLQTGGFIPSGGRLGLEASKKSGIAKIDKQIKAFLASGREGRGPSYLYRDSMLGRPGNPNNRSRVRIIQQTYLRNINLVRQERDITTYPASPIANLVVVIVPGRCDGEYAINLETRSFVANPSRIKNEKLLARLNADIAPLLEDLWERDYDVLGGNQFARGRRTGVFKGRWVDIVDGLMCLEPIFCPTLFHSAALSASLWSGASESARPSELRVREFAAGLLPCAEFSLLIFQYPTPNAFDRPGHLVESGLRADIVGTLAFTCADLLRSPDYLDAARERGTAKDLVGYFRAVGGTHKRPTQGTHIRATSNPLDSIVGDYYGKFMTSSATNEPVLPVEAAYCGIAS